MSIRIHFAPTSRIRSRSRACVVASSSWIPPPVATPKPVAPGSAACELSVMANCADSSAAATSSAAGRRRRSGRAGWAAGNIWVLFVGRPLSNR